MKKCSEIDSLYADIQKQIETLEEYKKSVITEAVTKGLNPDVEMKDSGIEWVGKIPAHWKIGCIKRFCMFKTGKTPSTSNKDWFDGELKWFTPCDFSEKYNLTDSERTLSLKAKENNVVSIIPENTVMIVGIGGTAGKIGLTIEECSCNQQITALISKDIFYKYLMYWMISNAKFLKDTAMYTTLPILNNQTIGDYLLICPSNILEQKEIANHLDAKCTEIDGAIAEKKEQLSTLEQYKKSIIYEYVTGKKEAKA